MATMLHTDRLLVSRQDPESGRYATVGILSFDGRRYGFEYCEAAERPLPGLPFGSVHVSEMLFPVFAERVIDPRRPEWNETLGYLGLSMDAGPFKILEVSGGGRTGDTYELTPLPAPGRVSVPFLVHGVRFLSEGERAKIDTLAVGQQLAVRPEEDNPAVSRALLVTHDGARLGYVPTPLLEYVHDIVAREHELTVERVNPISAGLRLRLLVRLVGTYSGT